MRGLEENHVYRILRKLRRNVNTVSLDSQGFKYTHPLPASTSALLANDLELVLVAVAALEAAALAALETDDMFPECELQEGNKRRDGQVFAFHAVARFLRS